MATARTDRRILSSHEDAAVLNYTHAIIWIFDLRNHQIWWGNDQAVKFWCAPNLQDLIARDFSSDTPTVRKRLQQIVEFAPRNGSVQETWTLYPKDSPVTTVVEMTPVRIADDGRDALLIEATKFDTENAALSDIRMTEALRYTDIMISHFDMEGNLIALNASAAEAYGGVIFSNDGDDTTRSAAGLLARFVDPSHAIGLIEACRNGEEPSLDCRIKTANGNRWHKLKLRLARDPLTGSSIMIAVENDITELKEAVISLEVMSETLEERVEKRTEELRRKEEILRESERNYRAIVEDQTEMISRHTPDGKRTFVNEAYCRFHNKPKEQLLGLSAYEDMAPDELKRLHDLYQTLTPEYPCGEFEASFLGSDGDMRWQRWTKRAIFDDNLKVAEYQAVGRDVTERKCAEEQKRLAVEEAFNASAAKSKFLAALSHELRTPLNAIIGFSDIINQEYFGDIQPKYKEYAHDIHQSGTYLLALVNDLLDIAKIDAGKAVLTKKASDLRDLIHETIKIAGPKSQEKQLSIETEFSDACRTVTVDPRAIKQVLLNIIGNAQKFTPDKGRIIISLNQENDTSQISVLDTGEGIPKAAISEVTQLFSRGHRDPFHTEEGWGLGLAISKSLIELHGGELLIESKLKKGTKVTFTLPV